MSTDSGIDPRLMPLMYLAIRMPTENEVIRWGDNAVALCQLRSSFVTRLALPVATTALAAGMPVRRELIRWIVDCVRPDEAVTPENGLEKYIIEHCEKEPGFSVVDRVIKQVTGSGKVPDQEYRSEVFAAMHQYVVEETLDELDKLMASLRAGEQPA